MIPAFPTSQGRAMAGGLLAEGQAMNSMTERMMG